MQLRRNHSSDFIISIFLLRKFMTLSSRRGLVEGKEGIVKYSSLQTVDFNKPTFIRGAKWILTTHSDSLRLLHTLYDRHYCFCVIKAFEKISNQTSASFSVVLRIRNKFLRVLIRDVRRRNLATSSMV